MSKPAMVKFLESIQKLEDDWAVCEASLNDHNKSYETNCSSDEQSYCRAIGPNQSDTRPTRQCASARRVRPTAWCADSDVPPR